MIRKKSKIIDFESSRKKVIVSKLSQEYEVSGEFVDNNFSYYIYNNPGLSYKELSRDFHSVLIQHDQRLEW